MQTSTNFLLILTSGEPAGIGHDLIVQFAQNPPDMPLTILADQTLLAARAHALQLPWHCPKHWHIHHIALRQTGHVYPDNAEYVLTQLQTAVDLCLDGQAAVMVTCPVHKGGVKRCRYIIYWPH